MWGNSPRVRIPPSPPLFNSIGRPKRFECDRRLLGSSMEIPESISTAVDEIREQAKKDTEFSRDLAVKFFYHLALLSGAAISLFIPFLSSDVVQDNILSCSRLYIHITFISLVSSMVLSSLRNFVMMKEILRLGSAKHKMANAVTSAAQKGEGYTASSPRPTIITEIFGYIAIIAFIVGTVSAYIFASKVVF